MTIQGKLFKKNLVYLVLCFDKSLPWPIDIHGPKMSSYCNIECKNVSCDVGLSLTRKRCRVYEPMRDLEVKTQLK